MMRLIMVNFVTVELQPSILLQSQRYVKKETQVVSFIRFGYTSNACFKNDNSSISLIIRSLNRSLNRLVLVKHGHNKYVDLIITFVIIDKMITNSHNQQK